jgi:hypothetical protein
MRAYAGYIGVIGDIESTSADAIIEEYNRGNSNVFKYPFEAPEACSDEDVTLMARGIFFSNDWALDGTISFVAEEA